MPLEKPNPGIWIGGAVVVAALVVALSIPGKRPDPVKPPPAPEAPRPAVQSPPSAATNPPATPQPSVVVQPPPPSTPAAAATIPATTSPPAPAVTVPTTPTATVPPATTPPPAAPTFVTREAVSTALDNVQFALRDFRVALGGNPVGNNAEITSALLGNNLKQLALPQPDGSSVNAAGELCDPWGTPYFFHQQSGTKMEIRSAGADRKMWTADDIQM